jgi:hypothetical protein
VRFDELCGTQIERFLLPLTNVDEREVRDLTDFTTASPEG